MMALKSTTCFSTRGLNHAFSVERLEGPAMSPRGLHSHMHCVLTKKEQNAVVINPTCWPLIIAG